MKVFGAVVVALLMVLICAAVEAQEVSPLTKLKSVSGGLTPTESKFSIGGKVFATGVYGHGDVDPDFGVYDLGGKYTRFEAWVGVSDEFGGQSDKRFSIRLDGDIAVDNKDNLLSSGSKPVHIDLDVTGVRSLKITVSQRVFLGDPVLYKASSASSGVAILVAPQDGATVSASSISLLWEPVNGATGYGMEIVCTKGSSPRIYALNATDSTTRFDLTGVANGEYHWSVIAFNSKGVMGKFSKDRTFVVAR